MTITTNNVPRDLLNFHELTEKEQEEVSSVLDKPDEEAYFRYRKNLYYLSDFIRFDKKTEELKYWDGSSPDSAFSGVLVKICKGNDRVIVGRFCC